MSDKIKIDFSLIEKLDIEKMAFIKAHGYLCQHSSEEFFPICFADNKRLKYDNHLLKIFNSKNLSLRNEYNHILRRLLDNTSQKSLSIKEGRFHLIDTALFSSTELLYFPVIPIDMARNSYIKLLKDELVHIQVFYKKIFITFIINKIFKDKYPLFFRKFLKYIGDNYPLCDFIFTEDMEKYGIKKFDTDIKVNLGEDIEEKLNILRNDKN